MKEVSMEQENYIQPSTIFITNMVCIVQWDENSYTLSVQ